MYFKQFYLDCLAQASYMIGSEGEAAVVDPRRDVDLYLETARAEGLTIKYVIETHLHADFVSGHRELAERTGATIAIGAAAGAEFEHRGLREGDELSVGRVRLRILETPGHTPESISVLVFESADAEQPHSVLTGDTLFIGDVGRPDLVAARGYTAEQMAGMLYDSLFQKLLKLPDATGVYPAHGAGSLCGRNMSKETSSTIGEQRASNCALKEDSRDRFIASVTTGLPEVPRYFPEDVAINRRGAPSLGERPEPRALSVDDVARLLGAGAQLLDVRSAPDFLARHIPGSINIGLDGQFASWGGTLLDSGRPLVVVAPGAAGVEQALLRLTRVGLDRVEGFLDGGVDAWATAGRGTATLADWSVDELDARRREAELQVIDVRRPGEFEAGARARFDQRAAGEPRQARRRARQDTPDGPDLRGRLPLEHGVEPARAGRLRGRPQCARRLRGVAEGRPRGRAPPRRHVVSPAPSPGRRAAPALGAARP